MRAQKLYSQWWYLHLQAASAQQIASMRELESRYEGSRADNDALRSSVEEAAGEAAAAEKARDALAVQVGGAREEGKRGRGGRTDRMNPIQGLSMMMLVHTTVQMLALALHVWRLMLGQLRCSPCMSALSADGAIQQIKTTSVIDEALLPPDAG